MTTPVLGQLLVSLLVVTCTSPYALSNLEENLRRSILPFLPINGLSTLCVLLGPTREAIDTRFLSNPRKNLPVANFDTLAQPLLLTAHPNGRIGIRSLLSYLPGKLIASPMATTNLSTLTILRLSLLGNYYHTLHSRYAPLGQVTPPTLHYSPQQRVKTHQ